MTLSATRTPAGRAVRVLLAEDDAELRAMLAALLRRDGYEVVEAGDGVECLGFAQPWIFRGAPVDPPDVIVADLNMPGWSGLEVLDILRSGNAATPVILITGFGSEDTHRLAEHLGAVAVFDKPFEVDALLAVLHGLVPVRVRETGAEDAGWTEPTV
jgi:two-component system response regulator (stage 0 sporulation protein F)